jgi:preprotein translocase subunit SecF
MGKTKRSKKKKFKKKINPEQSNKMIYAVVAGLILLVAVYLFFTIKSDTVVDKKELMQDTLEYLKTTDDIRDVKVLPDQNKVVIVHETITKQNEYKDFPKIARYGGLKLSNKLGEEELTVVLCETTEKNPVYSVVLKGGRVVSDKSLK